MRNSSLSYERPISSFVCALGWMLLLSISFQGQVQAASSGKKQVKNKVRRDQRQGDISLRFSAGPQLYQMSTASGELLSSTIGERAFAITLLPEYSYYFLQNTSLFISVPLEIDVDLVVGATVGLGLGVGIRHHFRSFLFFDGQILLSFIRRSLLRLEFGGFAVGVGLSIPLGERFRLLVIGQVPFNFIDGFRFLFLLSVRGYLGFETFF